MGKCVQLVMGPAGSGTYCKIIQDHCDANKRTVHVANLDPAAEHFQYHPAFDLKDLISLEDVMDELSLGPNGGLIYCMEYLIDNLDWLRDQVADYSDDYLILDCPGQVELYNHVPVMRLLVAELQRLGYAICGVYCLDSQFVDDASKFISGTMMALSAMTSLEVCHVNVLTKCDVLVHTKGPGILEDDQFVNMYLTPDAEELAHQLEKNQLTPSSFSKMNHAIANVVSQYSMVQYIPLNREDEESVEFLLNTIDHAIQYGEDVEVAEPKENAHDEIDLQDLQDFA